MSFSIYAESIIDVVKNGFSHPVNAIIGFGDRSIGLIYYGVQLAISEGVAGKNASIGASMASKRIYDLLNYCSHHIREFNGYLQAYKEAYPGYKLGQFVNKALLMEIIFRKIGSRYPEVANTNKFQQAVLKQEAGIPLSIMAEYGYLVRADLSGRISSNHKIALQQIAYIIVTGESNLFLFRKVTPKPSSSGHNLGLEALKMLALARKKIQ